MENIFDPTYLTEDLTDRLRSSHSLPLSFVLFPRVRIGYAIPAVNCVSSCGINACLEAARKNDAPIIIQFSSGGAQFYGGKGLDNTNYRAAIAGAVSGAFHVRTMAEQYGVPVILHTDHCAKKLLPWIDGLLEASERYYKDHGEPLFSSHMIDLSEENIEICKSYLERMSKIGIMLEMELGITGGEEDGVDNSDRPIEDLYSKPEEIFQVYEALTPISSMFSVAAAFGNVHGVYKPGNVRLEPKILDRAQKYITEKLGKNAPKDGKPVMFVFHGGSGSDVSDIQESIGYGVIKMNIDSTYYRAKMWSASCSSLALTKSRSVSIPVVAQPTRSGRSGRGSRTLRPSTGTTCKLRLATRRATTSPTRSTTTLASASARPRSRP
jgi:fructose-bisphosphate aldolase class II